MQPSGETIWPVERGGKFPWAGTIRAGFVFFLIVLALGLNGCAGFGAAPSAPQYDSDNTRDLMFAMQTSNASLVSGKWFGNVSMTADGTRRTFSRVVWAGAEPGRMRLDARTPFGMPILSLACNESYFTIMAHNEGQYYRKRVGSKSLGHFIPVDISCRDLYRLMIGRPPVIDYHSARLEATTEGSKTIILKRRLKGTVAKLSLDESRGFLNSVELMDIHGNRRYRVQLSDRRMVEGFMLPHHLHFESGKGQLELKIARLYPNRPVTASLFQIPPPD